MVKHHSIQPYSLHGSLLMALHWVDESLQARLEAAGWERLSFAKSMIMLNVMNGVERPIELARKLGISRQAIHRTLREMLDDKLIALHNDPTDKRAKIVTFNAESAELMREALKALVAIQEDLARRLGQRNLDHLVAMLEKDWGPLSTGKE